MRRIQVLLVLMVLLLAGCGEIPTTVPPGQSPLPTEEAYPPAPTEAAVPPPTPMPPPTVPPTFPPIPTSLVITPTPYAPEEPLPAGFPLVAYAVKRGQEPAQLWTLRYEQGVLQEELLLDLDPESLEGRLGFPPYGGPCCWHVHTLAFSPDGQYLATGLDNEEGGGQTFIIRISDGEVYWPNPPEIQFGGFRVWLPGTERFIWESDGMSIWGTIAIDGSDHVQLPYIVNLIDTVVSLDGSRIVFSTSSFARIWLGAVDVDGSNLTPFDIPDPKPGDHVRSLTLSPDGQTCAFTWDRPAQAEGPPGPGWHYAYHGGGQIWIMDTEGSNQRSLGPDDTYDFDLAWSPDGRFILFGRQENPGRTMKWTDPAAALVSSLWLVDVESGQEQLLLASEGQYAHWSPQWLPDGSGLVFVSTRGGEANLWFVWSDGTGLQQLTQQGGLTSEIAVMP